MDFVETYYVDLVLGGLVLAFLGYTRLSLVRFRRRAICVSGKVVRVLRHHRTSSHFIAYELDGTTRHAEYRGWNTGLEPGAEVEILIDPQLPPDVRVPEHDEFRRVVGNVGQCMRPTDPPVTLWELLHLAVALTLIVRALLR